ncbi:hypothetical protein ZWY2020_052622 [Hordeum vulgare]|nr:hypothetical protein ZWY2020_052622 [Hordeum vulgare]
MRLRCWLHRCFARARLLATGDDSDNTPDDLLLLILARLPWTSAATRTTVLSRRWGGLWYRLRRLVFHEITLPSVEAALASVPLPPPTVPLLHIHVPDNKRSRRHVPKVHWEDTAHVNLLLRAAA